MQLSIVMHTHHSMVPKHPPHLWETSLFEDVHSAVECIFVHDVTFRISQHYPADAMRVLLVLLQSLLAR